jgi:hypothetical protein
MSLHDMVAGNNYLIGDSLGYDLVLCTQGPQQTEHQGSQGTMVKYKYIRPNGQLGAEDFLFVANGYHDHTYVEPR